MVLVMGVSGDTGAPLARAPFTYRVDSGPVHTTLSEDGTARIELDRAGRIWELRLKRTDGYAGSNVESAFVELGEEKRVTLTSTVGGILSGRVVDEGGQVVAGAEVRVWMTLRADDQADAIVFSSGDGSFDVPRVGPKFIAAARTDSMACLRGLRGELHPTTRCEGLELVVGPAARLAGTVVDSSGQPIEGAHLQLGTGLNSSGSHQSTSVPGISWFGPLGGADQQNLITGSDGRFLFEGQPAGAIQVRVEAADFVGAWMTLATKDSPVTVVLDRGLIVRGRVFLPDGGPAEGAHVRYSPRPQNTRAGGGSTVTGPTGDFVLTGLEPSSGETAHVTVRLEGYAVAALNPPAYEAGQGQSNDVRLERAQPLAGIVRYPSGEPAEGIRVVLDGGGRFTSEDPFIGRIRSWESEAGVDETVTDSEGRFTFGCRRRGAVSLRVHPSSDRRIWLNVDVAADDSDVEVLLDPGLARKVALQGRVVDATTGGPLPQVTLVLWRESTGSNHTLETEDGAFELSGVEPGTIAIEVRSRDHAGLRLDDRSFDVGEHDLGTLRLAPALVANLLIVDESGAPWTTGTLRVLTAEGNPVQFAISSGHWSSHAALRGNPLQLGELPAVGLTLEIEADGVTQEIPFDPRTFPGEDVIRVTVVRPQKAEAATIIVALIRRAALESPEAFAREMEEALRTGDREWMQEHLEQVNAAGPRSELLLEATCKDGLPTTAQVSWNPETKLYSANISNVISADIGTSSASVTTTERPVPLLVLEPRMRGRVLDLRLLEGETLLLQRSITISAAEEPTFVVLTY